MRKQPFIVIGEKIHCSRTVRTDGPRVRALGANRFVILYERNGEQRELPVPPVISTGREWAAGRVRPCTVAIHQALHGHGEEANLGADFLQALAEEQNGHGAAYLDINVDEFSTDPAQQIVAMRWTVGLVQDAGERPISVDSSHPAVLRAGLEVCDRSRGRPILNCVSLERPATFDLAAELDACAVVSAAGLDALPDDAASRVANLAQVVDRLRSMGRPDETLFLDPLVMPVATDGRHGPAVLEAIRRARQQFGSAIHITVGVSNVSFGLPARRLVNEVFAWLARDAGADSAIGDPAQIRADLLDRLDPASEPVRLARALLLNEDEFGMAFLAAAQSGRL